ncbi:DNA binding methylated-DNA--cysteine S-methyltransferase [Westerdykella ornata]|uniref:Methylated-DNA--protein-cysteine methyltransferase n=1 Tax=Westerdykella ornata TaxID=318751 RepID=A0A6A6JF99_WESOR|nr:DNA binding methylated-DNA--cysteine S-methyltransferase [Westerdykella ornata]KAF2274997.1 DNA binding methylated-DNA--cysteine S-methyltransferase [Westerdykella ornata]
MRTDHLKVACERSIRKHPSAGAYLTLETRLRPSTSYPNPLFLHSVESRMAKQVKVTEYQTRVYTLLQQIPEGRITSYAALARALNSSPRAVGGALRNNPFAPEVPCHRCIASTGVCRQFPHDGVDRELTGQQFVGGFKGDWEKVPSGQNQVSKLKLLADEGVKFDAKGRLVEKWRWWNDFDVDKL